MSEREHRTYEVPCEVRSAQRVIEAVIPYNREDEIAGAFVETLASHAFERSARERSTKVPLLFGHQSDLPPVGRSKRLTDSVTGLAMELSVARTDRGDELLALANEGALPGISPGFNVPPGGDEWTDLGRRRTIREAKLIEISLTAFPAWDGARVLAVRSVADAAADLDVLLGRQPLGPVRPGRSVLLARRELDLIEMEFQCLNI